MKISSFIQDSFQEYQDKYSLVLFSSGCNLSCPECYNFNQIKQEGQLDAKEVIDQYINPLHEAIVFLGGEPTIWNDLPDLVKYVKEEKKLLTKVYTNGLNPDMVKRLLQENYIDSFSVDIKTITNMDIVGGYKESNRSRSYIYLVDKTIKSIIDSGKNLELRTTKFTGIDLPNIIDFVQKNYPGVEHIIQDLYTPA